MYQLHLDFPFPTIPPPSKLTPLTPGKKAKAKPKRIRRGQNKKEGESLSSLNQKKKKKYRAE